MLENIKYFIRKHFTVRWHIIKTALKPGYHDPDERLLYGAMQCLVEFIEDHYSWGTEELLKGKEEIIQEQIKEADEESKAALGDQFNHTKEAVEIYKWWKKYLQKDKISCIHCKLNNNCPGLAYCPFLDTLEKELALYEEASEMLIRLIKIRATLWT